MQIQIHAADVSHSDAINERVHKELSSALALFDGQITRAEVHLHDANGPKAGVDKRVVIEVRIAGQQPLAVEHEGADMYDTIHQAAQKLFRAVKHKLDRRDEKRRTA